MNCFFLKQSVKTMSSNRYEMFSSKVPLYVSQYNDKTVQQTNRSLPHEYDLRPRHFQNELKPLSSKNERIFNSNVRLSQPLPPVQTKQRTDPAYFQTIERKPPIVTDSVSPCGENGTVVNGICKLCPINNVFDSETQLCKLKPQPLSKSLNKICPKNTIDVGGTCHYPCPNGMIPDINTNQCTVPNNKYTEPTLTVMRCPTYAPYFHQSSLQCKTYSEDVIKTSSNKKNNIDPSSLPLVFRINSIPTDFTPCSATSSLF